MRVQDWIFKGGDERVHLVPDTGKNKYHLNAFEFEGLFHRGSCTAGILNKDTNQTLQNIDLEYFEKNFEQVLKSHSSRIKRLFDNEEKVNFEVFFAPSGSDLVYYPLLFSKLLYPGENPANIVTCPEELGSGSLTGSQGKYFFKVNQFGESVDKGSFINNELIPEMHILPARNADGHIYHNADELRNIIRSNKDKTQIINLVYGSKSGIQENLNVKDEFELDKALWTVDLCQLRIHKTLIKELLDKGYILMLTGSKFYQAPPFCGCLLVPNSICARLSEVDASYASHFSNVFSAYDIPACLPNVREHLRPFKNLGLHLRWEVGLSEMEAFDAIDSEKSDALIDDWNSTMVKAIDESPLFHLMPDTEKTNKTIISFRVRKGEKFLNYNELKHIFDRFVTREDIPLDGYNRAFIGQPVKYGERAFLRIAIGSQDIRELLDQNHNSFGNDLKLLRILEKHVEEC